ncbi:MAG: response regulator transcription factor [Eubacteriales bacterium]|nr:response regulator transcription factor [Eubacteriales bacterium]
MKKVLIADDQKLFADMLKKIVETYEAFEVVACAENGRDACQKYKEFRPDVCLLDIQMPETNGIYALKHIKEEFPTAKAIMLTTFSNDENILDAYLNGADGYLLKDILPDALINAIHCVLDGQCVLNKNIQEFVSTSLKNSIQRKTLPSNENSEIPVDFQGRDLEIICLIAKGMSNRDIATTLNYSEGTVRNRISGILSATGLSDRTQIALLAIKNHLV